MSSDRGNTPTAGKEAGTFSAADLKRQMAERQAARAAEELQHMREQEEKQKAVIEEFHKPPARTPEQLMQLIMRLVTQAAEHGQSEIQIYRFPNSLCTDGGRRINNSLPDWEKTLEGRPKLGYEFWHDHLRPLGFGLKAEVIEYPGGMPGDIGFFLTWK
jgi:hypothetical protein